MLDRFEQAAMAFSFVVFAYGVLYGLKVAVQGAAAAAAELLWGEASARG